VAVVAAKKSVQVELATRLRSEMQGALDRIGAVLAGGYTWENQAHKSCRDLRAILLVLLIKAESAEGAAAPDASTADVALALQSGADNMSDEMAGFTACCVLPADSVKRTEGIKSFGDKWKDDGLVIDKWLRMVACTAEGPEVLAELEGHPAFSISNPNKVYSVLGGFAFGNPKAFHDPSGKGYAAVAEMLKRVDEKNAQVGARMAGCFLKARTATPSLRAMQVDAVKGLMDGASKNLREILSQTLKSVEG